jgi:hypothetical protein
MPARCVQKYTTLRISKGDPNDKIAASMQPKAATLPKISTANSSVLIVLRMRVVITVADAQRWGVVLAAALPTVRLAATVARVTAKTTVVAGGAPGAAPARFPALGPAAF